MKMWLLLEHREVIEQTIALLRRKLRISAMDADDFAQDARMALLANDELVLRRFSGRSSLGTYLYVVLRRFGVRWLQTQWRRRDVSNRFAAVDRESPVAETGDGMVADHQAATLAVAVRQLNALDRVILTLRRQGARIDEIALLLDLSANAVSQRWKRLTAELECRVGATTPAGRTRARRRRNSSRPPGF